MALWDDITKAFKSARGAAGAEWSAAGETVAGALGKGAKAFSGGGEKISGVLPNLAYGAGRLLGPKPWLIGGGVLAATAVVGTYFAVNSKPKRDRSFDEPLEPIPQLLTPQDLMMQAAPNMAMGGPVEGYGEYQWRNMVNSSRGQALEQPVVNTAQPRMSAIDPDAVRDLGALKAQTV